MVRWLLLLFTLSPSLLALALSIAREGEDEGKVKLR